MLVDMKLHRPSVTIRFGFGICQRTGRMKARQEVCEILGSDCCQLLNGHFLFSIFRRDSGVFMGFVFFFQRQSMIVNVAVVRS